MSEQAIDIGYALEGGAEAFEITDDVQADFAVRRVLENNAERDRLIKLALDMAEDYRQKAARIAERYERKNKFDMDALHEYFNRIDKRETKTQKSYRLLSGRLLQKAQSPLYAYDADGVLAWAKVNAPQFVKEKTTVSLDWAELKKALTVVNSVAYFSETGEELPITVNDRPDTFEVTA